MASNKVARIPEPITPVGSFLWSSALFSSMFGLFAWFIYYAITTNPDHPHPAAVGIWIVPLIGLLLGSLAGATKSRFEVRLRLERIQQLQIWNGRLDTAQHWQFPVLAIRRSSWETTVVANEDDSPPGPDAPGRQIQIVFLPVGVEDASPRSHTVSAAQVFWNGVEDSPNLVEWPKASLDSSGRIVSYGAMAIGTGPAFRGFPLVPADRDSLDRGEDLRWQVAREPNN